MKQHPHKRILIWSASYAPIAGGLQSIVSELAKGLQQGGHTVQVLTNKIPSSLPSKEIIDGVVVSRLRFFHLFRSVSSVKDAAMALYGAIVFPWRLFQIICIMRRFKPDVVNVHFPGQQIWFLGILQNLFTSTRWIISLHGDEILQFFDFEGNNRQQSIREKLSLSQKIKLNVLKKRITKSHAFTACSSYLMEMAGKLYGKGKVQGEVVYNGIDYTDFITKQPRLISHDYIFACGRLAYTKGFDLLVKAYALLPESIKKRYALVIAGTGAEREKLIALAIALKVQNRVQFYGKTNKQVTSALLQHSALMVVPSRRETFGIVLLEGLAAGVKVVATNVGGIPEIAKQGDVTLCEPNAESIAHKIAATLGDSTSDVSSNASLLRHFSKESMLEKYEAVLFS